MNSDAIITEPVVLESTMLVRIRSGSRLLDALSEMTDLAILTGRTIEGEFNGSLWSVGPWTAPVSSSTHG